MATTASVENVDMSLVERIAKIEESLKDLKRAARHELKARRRRRGPRAANGEKVAKGETPQQLKAWHDEVRKVWDELCKTDAKTPYKRAVAEASARRKGASTPVATPVVAAAPVVEKKAKKAKAEAIAAPAPVEAAPVAEAPKKKVSKKSA